MKLFLLSSTCSSLRSRHAYKITVSQGLPLGTEEGKNRFVNLPGRSQDAESRNKSER